MHSQPPPPPAGELLRYVHDKLLTRGLHAAGSVQCARYDRCGLNPLQRQLFAVSHYPNVIVIENLAVPRSRTRGIEGGGLTMPQPPLGYNKWGYVCRKEERGTGVCNNDGSKRFAGTAG